MNMSNTVLSCDGGMPMPLSRTEIAARIAPVVEADSRICPPVFGIFRCVVQEVGEDLRQPHGVARRWASVRPACRRRASARRSRSIGRLVSIAARRTASRSSGSWRTSITPRVIRDTSRRSSTSRTRCAICRSITAVHARTTARIRQAREFQQLQAGQQGRERISQFVAKRGEELVLALIGVAERLFGALAIGQVAANLILALARAKSCADGAHQRRDTNRPLEQRHVPQRPDRIDGIGRIRARTREHEHGQVRPGGLAARTAFSAACPPATIISSAISIAAGALADRRDEVRRWSNR